MGFTENDLLRIFKRALREELVPVICALNEVRDAIAPLPQATGQEIKSEDKS